VEWFFDITDGNFIHEKEAYEEYQGAVDATNL
jgi:hypothetical protein